MLHPLRDLLLHWLSSVTALFQVMLENSASTLAPMTG